MKIPRSGADKELALTNIRDIHRQVYALQDHVTPVILPVLLAV